MPNCIMLNIYIPLFDYNEFTTQLRHYAETNNLYFDTSPYDFEYHLNNFVFKVNGILKNDGYNAILSLENVSALWELIDIVVNEMKGNNNG